jgi:hypothetical protein
VANDTYYADAVNGNDANDGLSEANAKQTLSALFGLGSGGGNLYYVQAGGNYTLTSTAAFAISGDLTDGRNVVEGYTTTPGARDGMPTITSATNSVALLTLAGTDYVTLRHLRLTHTAGTRGHGVANTTGDSLLLRVEDCEIDGCNVGVNEGFSLTRLAVVRTTIKHCISHGITCLSGVLVDRCLIHGNGGRGVNTGFSETTVLRSVVADNAYGVYVGGTGGLAIQLVVEDSNLSHNTNAGLLVLETTLTSFFLTLANSIFWGNGGYGADFAAATGALSGRTRHNFGNAYGGNTSGSRNNLPAGIGDVTLTADPFTNAAGGDFSLNATAGGGAACREAGFPGAFPGGTTTGYLDIGAVQHQDAGGGGGSGVSGARIFTGF